MRADVHASKVKLAEERAERHGVVRVQVQAEEEQQGRSCGEETRWEDGHTGGVVFVDDAEREEDDPQDDEGDGGLVRP